MMNEILMSYQLRAGVANPERTRLLEKLLAAACAYSAPCFVGEANDGTRFYQETVAGTAMKIISEVNERCLIKTDQVLADLRLLWMGRYEQLNSPHCNYPRDAFYASLSVSGQNLRPNYDYWVDDFVTAVGARWTQLTGGV